MKRPDLHCKRPASAGLSRRSLGAALLALPAWARAQSVRPLRIVVPFTPGGSTDILARALAPRLAQALGQPVVVDNRPGAGGSLGAAEAAKADPDGQTLLMGHIGTLGVNPSMYPKLAYDPLRSFVPVAYVAGFMVMMAVLGWHPDPGHKKVAAPAHVDMPAPVPASPQ